MFKSSKRSETNLWRLIKSRTLREGVSLLKGVYYLLLRMADHANPSKVLRCFGGALMKAHPQRATTGTLKRSDVVQISRTRRSHVYSHGRRSSNTTTPQYMLSQFKTARYENNSSSFQHTRHRNDRTLIVTRQTVQLAQMTFGTGSTLDDLYVVTSSSHNVWPGSLCNGTDPQSGVVRGQCPRTAMCVRNVDVHVSCSSHVDAQLAAFFIDPRAK